MNRWKTAISLGGMLGVLLLTSAATTQQDPERSSLKQLGSMQSVVEEALRNSAEVHLAEAKVRQAELELTQVRMAVVRQAVGLLSDIDEAKQSLSLSQRNLSQVRAMYESALCSEREVLKVEAEVINLTGKVQRMNLELDFLAGRVDLAGEQQYRGLGGAPGTSSAMRERKLPAGLQLPLEASFEDVNLGMALEFILKGTEVHLVDETGWAKDEDFTISLTMSGTRHQWLTALADVNKMVFVVRDYGLLLTTRENAASYNAITIPVDFTAGG